MIEDQTRLGTNDCIRFIERTNQGNFLRINSEKGKIFIIILNHCK